VRSAVLRHELLEVGFAQHQQPAKGQRHDIGPTRLLRQ
jgi:hypothetical protein